MGKNYIADTFKVLSASENLKRLLWYPPQDLLNNTPDPLSPLLPNISDDDELNWKVIDDRILLTPKSDDLVTEPKCRLYLYLGGCNTTNNPFFFDQDIIIDVLWHEKYNSDLRFNSILSTLNKLLVDRRITGMGKMKFRDGSQINVPRDYQGYSLIYQVGSMSK